MPNTKRMVLSNWIKPRPMAAPKVALNFELCRSRVCMISHPSKIEFWRQFRHLRDPFFTDCTWIYRHPFGSTMWDDFCVNHETWYRLEFWRHFCDRLHVEHHAISAWLHFVASTSKLEPCRSCDFRVSSFCSLDLKRFGLVEIMISHRERMMDAMNQLPNVSFWR